MFKSLFLALLFIVLGFNGNCYAYIPNDSIKLFPKSIGNKKWKILVGLDARRSFFESQKVKINGIRLGIQFKGVHRFGFGFYNLSKDITFKNITVDKPDAQLPTQVLVDVNYNSIFYERVFLKTKRWEISLPLHLGKGLFKRQYLNNLGNFKQWDKKSFSLFNVGFQVKFYLLSWLAPRISFGYRYTYKTLPEIQEAFNKPYYAYGLSISIGELIRTIFNSN